MGVLIWAGRSLRDRGAFRLPPVPCLRPEPAHGVNLCSAGWPWGAAADAVARLDPVTRARLAALTRQQAGAGGLVLGLCRAGRTVGFARVSALGWAQPDLAPIRGARREWIQSADLAVTDSGRDRDPRARVPVGLGRPPSGEGRSDRGRSGSRGRPIASGRSTARRGRRRFESGRPHLRCRRTRAAGRRWSSRRGHPGTVGRARRRSAPRAVAGWCRPRPPGPIERLGVCGPRAPWPAGDRGSGCWPPYGGRRQAG